MLELAVDRRSLLMTSAAAGAPKIWLNFDQAALDAAYDQTVYAPNYAQVIERMISNSASTVERIGYPQTIGYGPSTIEKLHYYPARTAGAPLHIHVHGGAWRQRKAEGMFFMAETFINAGIGFAILDFTSVEETGGDLTPMLDQVCGGLAWLARNARTLGGDPERLYLSGFSSGAHLASAAMVADWSQFGFARMPYRGAVLASGMYDLRPVRLSARSRYVAFTDEIEERMSVQRHVERYDVPTIIAYGTYETPEFQRQAVDFAKILQEKCADGKLLICKGYNHYEMLEMFGNPYSPIGQALISQNI
ncbi:MULTISPECIES: alpha/beta hydrolase [unclassified Sphingomonas]|uniref:alpha/beta hydrolase n=1 Tax=unclassified Sphingomonas TaxID=196159 RepID=UPI0006F7D417|nr:MULTISPECIES: alpha/beta hydrolase [unclassified Sphingomonas]KQX18625.1 hypothetical protein ASD17_15930 [Sphingomonas sp. Root1294]KQY72052.1 hypothetical protein ASD39_19045 [Sphingomonas sp. Root50]KRB94679.1 hypothetical protein ASE22_01710 [Sphingomonas sp. Root720]